MQRWKNILFTVTIVLNCLLLFFLVVENKLVLPPWLQVAGRMHPLILHFPIVLLLLYATMVLFLPSGKENTSSPLLPAAGMVLLLAALSAALTAIVGLLLSREGDYDPEALQWHKWSGAAISFFTLAWYYFSKPLQLRKFVTISMSFLAFVLVIFAGHQGAGITHGQNFLLAPLLPEKKDKLVSLDEAIVFTHLVQPILEEKCMSCHNSSKAKGNLVMETEALLLKGGKSGPLWDSLAPDLGLFLNRVHLPLEEKKHMPPQGKPQLTEEEIALLTHWISKGADFKLRVADLPATDSLYQLAVAKLQVSETAAYDFPKADATVIAELNTVNRVVTEEALHSPALSVSFFNSKLFDPAQLRELVAVKKQIVSLDLSRMPVKDEDLAVISELENLRRLNLGFTAISGASLSSLQKLKYLHTLSLSGTAVNAQQLALLSKFPGLKTVYTWNTPLAATDLSGLQKQVPGIRFESGFRGDTIVLRLSPPSILNEEGVVNKAVPLQLKHYIQGVEIRYTTDGTEPDSIHSPVFKDGILIEGNKVVKAKAYKTGWISSELAERSFYMSSHQPDSVVFITQPDPAYTGKAALLIDRVKGETNFRNGNWLAWRQTKMEVLLQFNKATTVSSVTLSSLIDVNSYLMPPQSVEVWGGDSPAQLKRLGSISPVQPAKTMAPLLRGYECTFAPVTVSYIKVIGTPVMRLPSWHPGKGDKGWLFTDEILIN